MRAVEIDNPGGPEVLKLVDRPIPSIASGEVLIRVIAAGINRPDISQRIGLYPPPPGCTDIPGLEVAGVVKEAADDVVWPRAGETVCALVAGGGYAEYCAAPAVQCLPIPKGLDLQEAAVLPEVFFTTWNSVVWLAHLTPGETIVIHGGTSGVGLATLQVAKTLFDACTITTSGSDEKAQVCREMGADHTLSYHGEWQREILDVTGGRGADIIVDSQAGPYVARGLEALAFDGRLVLLATHQGPLAEINCRRMMRRRLTLTGTLRPRSPEYKGRIAVELRRDVWPLLASKTIHIPICARFSLERVQDAHRLLDANKQIGKVVLAVTH